MNCVWVDNFEKILSQPDDVQADYCSILAAPRHPLDKQGTKQRRGGARSSGSGKPDGHMHVGCRGMSDPQNFMISGKSKC